jgi:hypothetical protein
MMNASASFLVAALAAGSTTPLCSDSLFAQQLPAQGAAAQPALEAAASQSAQEPAGQAAANCPGRPDALGTSRVLAIDPAQYPRIGCMQYRDSLSLNDKEVVLTLDDGPILPYSTQILDILASQCVKATYFLVGEMARAVSRHGAPHLRGRTHDRDAHRASSDPVRPIAARENAS